MRGKSKVGEVRGDFKVLERTGRHYKCQCIHCGALREYSETTVGRGRMRCSCEHEVKKICLQCKKEFTTSRNARFCSDECRIKFYIGQERLKCKCSKRYNRNRKYNNTTCMLICVYTAEGMSIKEIADCLHREVSLVKMILSECKKNGKYDFFINNSPILQIRGKKKCT